MIQKRVFINVIHDGEVKQLSMSASTYTKLNAEIKRQEELEAQLNRIRQAQREFKLSKMRYRNG